ncbi:TRAF3-interacting protein 1-like isoform X1 [Colias croceus]|uniref:TRAF3-interacting protein 1-like isoform X1 n=1 Tax=Colias crocea TaxID=72248 RepID=UPI001E27CEF5|nr:TRAF3-interacting protein 1-like isoform X1 [Colias croceus]
MSDNEDLLGEDLGDHSLADYNLGNDEEEQLLADDYDGANSQNVPSARGTAYREQIDVVPTDYAEQNIEYTQPVQYAAPEAECVVPNIVVEVPNTRPEHSTYAPYEPTYEREHAVPPPIPAAPMESPQIVPSEMAPLAGDLNRERFTSERPVGSQRTPQIRNIPDSLDKVYVPRAGRGRGAWRPHRHAHPYRRNNMQFRANFAPRPSFPPPRHSPPQMRPEIPEIRHEPPQDRQIQPEIRPEFQNFQRFYRPNMEETFPNQNFERPMFPVYRPFVPREIVPNNLPQVIRQPLPVLPGKNVEQEVRMLPVLPPNLPPLTGKKVLINPHFKGNFQPPVEGLPAYIPTRIQKTPPLSPTLEQKFGPIKDIDDAAERFIAEQRSALARAASRNLRRSPQRYIENTTIEIENELARSRRNDDELLRKQEEFIHANRAGLRRRMRSPSPPPRRSPSPVREHRREERRTRPHDDEDSEYRRKVREQESLRERVLRAKEVRRRKNAVALQKQLQDREREIKDKDKPKDEPKAVIKDKDTKDTKDKEKDKDIKEKPSSTKEEDTKPDTTEKSPEIERVTVRVRVEEKQKEKERDRSPLRDEVEVNSTCEALTPPRPVNSTTPPLPRTTHDSDDDLDLILGDIDGILSDDEDTGRFKDDKTDSSKSQTDLRSKLPPKNGDKKTGRQKITFTANEEKKKEKSPIRRTIVTSSTKNVETEKKTEKVKPQAATNTTAKSRQRIVFDAKKAQTEKTEDENAQKFTNRRVILQRKGDKEKSVFSRIDQNDPTKPNPGIFSRAFKSIGTERIVRNDTIQVVDRKELSSDGRKVASDSRKVASDSRKVSSDLRKVSSDGRKMSDEPEVEYESGSDDEGVTKPREVGLSAAVSNLPHGMTDTRLRTLAGDFVQSLILDKEERTAKITFKTTSAAENFKKKFNNKMVAASRLTVVLQ